MYISAIIGLVDPTPELASQMMRRECSACGRETFTRPLVLRPETLIRCATCHARNPDSLTPDYAEVWQQETT